MPRSKKIVPASTIVDNVRSAYRLHGRDKEYEALKRWPEIVGSRIAEHTEPLYIVDHHLYVSAKGSVWCQELSFCKNEIIEKLNEIIGHRLIKDIKFKVK